MFTSQPKTHSAPHSPLTCFFLLAAALFFLCSGPSQAAVDKDLTFRWKANPPQDNVTGYRLYFGSQSRFASNGSQKSNFSYDYYIDLADSLLCNTANSTCRYLDYNELSCKNLNGSTPTCTIDNPGDKLYFALTACAASDESNYTAELRSGMSNTAILPVINLLLLN